MGRRSYLNNIAAVTAVSAVSLTLAPGASAQASTTAAEDQPSDEPDKSIAFYVGADLTDQGHPLIGGFGHEPSSHWVEVVPEQTHDPEATIEVGATEDADLPGQITEIPQAEQTHRYITSNYSEFAGFPAPLMNGGLNDQNVAARDVWSPSREELVEATPDGQTGPQYSDLSRIAMERASSAEEAVTILGDLIDEHGYTTYGGNSHMFADEDEGWVFIEFAGGEGLWAAERLGPEEIRVSYPGYIQDFPTEAAGEDHPDFRGSENLVSYAEDEGWYDSEEDDTFNLQEVYGVDFPTEDFGPNEQTDPEDEGPYRHPLSLEDEIAELDGITLEDMLRLVRDPRWSDDRAGYGHVAEMRDDLDDPSLATLWLAPTAAATAPYTPIAVGSGDLPVEFSQHRYLTAESPSSFLAPEFMEQEATEYATQTFKRLMYATCARPDEYLDEVTAAFEGFEAESIDQWNEVQEDAAEAVSDGEDAQEILTDYTNDRALAGLQLGNHLLDDILTRSREDGGLHDPDVEQDEGTTASARSESMVLDGVAARDRVNCDVGGGWSDGNTVERAGDYGDPSDVPDYSGATISGHAEYGGGDASGAPSAPGWVWGLGGMVIGGAVIAALFLLRNRTSG